MNQMGKKKGKERGQKFEGPSTWTPIVSNEMTLVDACMEVWRCSGPSWHCHQFLDLRVRRARDAQSQKRRNCWSSSREDCTMSQAPERGGREGVGDGRHCASAFNTWRWRKAWNVLICEVNSLNLDKLNEAACTCFHVGRVSHSKWSSKDWRSTRSCGKVSLSFRELRSLALLVIAGRDFNLCSISVLITWSFRRSWVILSKFLVWLVSFSRSGSRRWLWGAADVSMGSCANSSENRSEKEVSTSNFIFVRFQGTNRFDISK